MRIALLAVVFILIIAVSSVLYIKYRMDNAPDNRNLEAEIDAEVSKTLKGGQFTGMVVGVYKDGRKVVKGYGSVQKEATIVPDANTVFQIGSISKLLTATLLQSLCDEGVVSMDATLGELIGGTVRLSASAQAVTLRQLVTHTSGFPRVPKSLEEKSIELAGGDDPLLDPYSYLGPKYIFDYLETTDDKRDPGRFEYSNYGMGLLGHVLEVVTGKGYEFLVKEKILTPLGMHNTAITLTPNLEKALAQGYTAEGNPTRVWRFAALGGAGAFSSTAEDMLTFIQANVEQRGRASHLFSEMRVPQFGGDSGIGWIQPTFIDRFLGNRSVVWHNGMVGGYASYLSVDLETKTGVVILTNQASAPDMLGMMLTRKARTQSWLSSAATL